MLRHVLLRRFRQARNVGLLHCNAERLIQLVYLLLKVELSAAMAYLKPRPTLTCTGAAGP
ncbi:MAG TPA: hypothetical protein VFJ15_15165 [Oleiagrimonas sp.]|nr:hypothetical protein [Oleiagrimonas sp.]